MGKCQRVLYRPEMRYSRTIGYRLVQGEKIMKGNKSAEVYSRRVPVITGTVLCLIAFVAVAQTPAQDNARIEADKKAVEKATAAVKNDNIQLIADQVARKTDAVQADTARLAADKKNLSVAEDKLKADMLRQSSDDARFSGAPNSSAPSSAQTGPGTIPGTAIIPSTIAPTTAPAPATSSVTAPGTAKVP